MYRPQFIFEPAAPPCEEQVCRYSFDGTNTPGLVGTLAAGAQLAKIPLLIDTDAPFWLRSIRIVAGGLMVRIEDGSDNPLSDCNNQSAQTNYEFPELYSQTDGAGDVAIDSDDWGIFIPAGGAPALYLYNPTAAPVNLSAVFVNLAGVKRYAGGSCQ